MVRDYLEMINPLLTLTHRELDILSLIVSYNYDLLKGDCKPISSTELRKSIMNNTQVNKNNLSKYINTFISKNIVKYDGLNQTILLNNSLIPVMDSGEINIEFKLIIK